ncbi:MAG: hypothetical protein H6725_05810 [Sandaracinaceae bacterium]|nr:hypothetical protein [Sandaracinaceae bacterium]
MDRNDCNAFRYEGGREGHYESYFQRANHPSEPRAFWIRYTVFSPKGRPSDAVGELWAIYFDGLTGRITPVKTVIPYRDTLFARFTLDARIGSSTLDGSGLVGEASSLGHTLAWDLRYTSPEPPLLLLPERLYGASFPKAKALVGSPMAVFSGSLQVDGVPVSIDGWTGSQNHNWGEKHTDEYAWGQVAGFDDAPGTFLELSTARVRVGPVSTPWMTPIVLRHEGQEHRLNAITTSIRAKARYEFFRWEFASQRGDLSVSGVIEAEPSAFVGLPYDNPPGGRKTCINSKLASCRLTVTAGKRVTRLATKHRAAFEILTARDDHGVRVLAV